MAVPMAVPGSKQKCNICAEEVTDADYRRELTCTYGACPGSVHAYHEDCITKYLRKLKLPTDQLIGYACPVTLDNGKPCSGRIMSTHHRQPLNQKKKQKRVEAAAAAASFVKPKPIKAKEEMKPAVAAATTAMRPAVSSLFPAVKGSVHSVAPGSGPAARLKGTPAALGNSTALIADGGRRHIPGWTGPDKVSKPGMSALEQQRELQRALVAQQRAKAAALKAEVEASKGRKNQSSVLHVGAAVAKDTGGLRDRQSCQQQRVDDSDRFSEASDTHPYTQTPWDGGLNSESGEGSPTPPEKPQDFVLAQEDFPAFTTTAHDLLAIMKGVQHVSAKERSSESSAVQPREEQMMQSSGGSSVNGSPLVSVSSAGTGQVDVLMPVSPAAAPDGLDEDPVVSYELLYEGPDGHFVVMDENGEFYYMESLYGPTPEIIQFDDGSGLAFNYVVVRQSMIALHQAQQEMATTPTFAAGGATAGVPEPIAVPPLPMSLAPEPTVEVPERTVVAQHGGLDKSRSFFTAGLSSIVQEANTGAQITDGEDVDATDLDDLLALCMVSAPMASVKPAQATALASPETKNMLYGNMAFNTNPYAATSVVDTPVIVSDGVEAEDVDSLLKLLRV